MTRIPKFHELMWPTLKAIEKLSGSATVQEIAEQVNELEKFTEEQQAILHGDGPQSEIEYRLAWARSYLKGIGALDNSQRGVWSITEQGRALTEADMAEIPTRYRAARRGAQGERETGAEEEAIWRDELLDILRSMNPETFERLAQRLLREAGFQNVRVTNRGADGGIDGSGMYRISLVSFPVFFQCKRWGRSVRSREIRDFRGAMEGRGDRGLFITTASFTEEAKNEARREGATPVDLVDGRALCDLLKEYGLGARVTGQRVIEEVQIDPQFFDTGGLESR